MEFSFVGNIGASKSLFNRALIISSYNPDIQVLGDAHSDDVDLMQKALADIGKSTEFECGSAGTVLRFLALRLAREKGIFKLNGSPRLMGRLLPQLQQTLSQLGAESRMLNDAVLELDCDGWRPRGDGLWIPSGESSQFASAVLLNAWNLKAPIHFVRSGELVSDSYFQLSLDLVRSFGLVVDTHQSEVSIAAAQTPKAGTYIVECDVSSAFTVAALAALSGHCEVQNFPERSLQPDAIFITHLMRMGVPLEQSTGGLKVSKAARLEGVSVDLRNSPDLFPVLATLSCFAKSPSQYSGLAHLEHKESDRLKKVIELTEKLGAKWSGDSVTELILHPPTQVHNDEIQYDADEDHRLVMAAAVAQAGGYRLTVSGTECISKSFQGFQDIWPLLR